MKKHILFLILINTITACSQNTQTKDFNESTQIQTPLQTSALKTYQSSDGYSLQYPDTWTIQESTETIEKVEGNVFSFTKVMIINSLDPQFKENITISLEELPNDTISLFQYTQAVKKLLPKTYTQVEILREKSLTLGKHTANQITYTATQNNITLTLIQTYLVNTQRAYVITGTTTEETFEEDKEGLQHIINSFKLL